MEFRVKLLVLVLVSCISSLQSRAVYAEHPLIDTIQNQLKSGQISQKGMSEIRSQANQFTDSSGRVTSELQKVLYEIEARFKESFSADAQAEFQALVAEVGAKMHGPIQMPKDQTPFWHLKSEEFADYRSTPEIPKKVDFVIIGAGLTGSSAAYHLRKAAEAGKTVIVIDEADRPAAQASGRNGGNFQLLSESYTENYDGLVQERSKWLRPLYPNLDEAKLESLSVLQVKALLQFNYHNFLRFTEIVKRERIDCDFTPQGWLRIANTKAEEDGVLHDLDLIQSLGVPTEVWSPQEIESRLHIPAQFAGRLIVENGNYHPYKFVMGLLKKGYG